MFFSSEPQPSVFLSGRDFLVPQVRARSLGANLGHSSRSPWAKHEFDEANSCGVEGPVLPNHPVAVPDGTNPLLELLPLIEV